MTEKEEMRAEVVVVVELRARREGLTEEKTMAVVQERRCTPREPMGMWGRTWTRASGGSGCLILCKREL
jgi:hypothetical protein